MTTLSKENIVSSRSDTDLSEILYSNASSRSKSGSSKAGLFFIGLTGGAAVLLSIVCLPFVSPALRRVCLPYVPATPAQICNVLTALRGRSGRLIDLGSGDGRIVLSAAKAGFTPAEGVELNPWLVIYSKIEAFRSGLSPKTSFHRKDLWKFNLEPYPNVVVFGVEEMMVELESKLNRELQDGAHIVACRFPLPSLQPCAIIGSGVDTVWLYKHQCGSNRI